MKWSPLDKARHYGTPVVAETSDWLVNSVLRDSRLSDEDIQKCFKGLKSLEDGGKILEGQFGGGAGMTCVSLRSDVFPSSSAQSGTCVFITCKVYMHLSLRSWAPLLPYVGRESILSRHSTLSGPTRVKSRL